MKRAMITSLLITLLCGSAAAVEVGTFVNLGFSPDSSVFSFGFYGIADAKGIPHAEAYFVDVEKNAWITEGQFTANAANPVILGQDGYGTFYKLLLKTKDVFVKTGVDLERPGRLVYILLNGEQPKEVLDFKDFETNISYLVKLKQEVKTEKGKNGSADHISSAFSINLSLTSADGKVRTWTIGRPSFFRPDVQGYKIRQILVAPSGQALVFVLEKLLPPGSPDLSTFMVETLSIK